ncbi:MAG: proton-conducting transporter membrane subunit [Holophaga sp.]
MMLASLFLATVLIAALSGLPGLLGKDLDGKGAARLLALSALGGLGVAGATLAGPGWALDLAWSLPGARFTLRGDALGALFLMPVALVPAILAHYGTAYWPDSEHDRAPTLRFCFGLAVAAITLLCFAANAILFLVAWEVMAITCFLMVASEDRDAEVREASWIYLVAAHTGTLCLFGGFALVASARGSFDLGPIPMGWASGLPGTLAFLLFLMGFSLKAGLMPVHVWLPVAHAAAPSHVSAFLSGLITKMGILGLVRVMTWIPDPPLWWGGTLLTVGGLSAVLGLAFALGQRDMKRALAYSTIENIGLIAMGLGLAGVGKSTGNGTLVMLAGSGALLHVLNHSLFKSLLFLGAGSVAHATGTRNLERLGGLLKTMPWTGALFLVGATAIAGLPPFNGFVSEWLIYLGAFQSLPGWAWGACAIFALCLAGGLALATFARLFGITFLGEPRSETTHLADESPQPMLSAMKLLAAGCALIGLAPFLVFPVLDRAVSSLGPNLPYLRTQASPGLLSLVNALGLGFAWIAWLSLRNMASRPSGTWDCGYAAPTSRIQYTASSFAQLLEEPFRWALWPVRHLPRIRGLFPGPSHFRTEVPDPVLDRGLKPLFTVSSWVLGWMRVLQAGHLPIYLLYVVLTLVALLAWTLT